MTVDLSKLSFYSSSNYMKRSTFVGTTLLTIPASGSVVSHTISHNLGYVPFMYVGANVDNDGVIWSNQKVYTNTNSVISGLFPSQIQQIFLSYTASTTQLTIYLDNQTTTAAGQQRRIYWVVYLDYST